MGLHGLLYASEEANKRLQKQPKLRPFKPTADFKDALGDQIWSWRDKLARDLDYNPSRLFSLNSLQELKVYIREKYAGVIDGADTSDLATFLGQRRIRDKPEEAAKLLVRFFKPELRRRLEEVRCKNCTELGHVVSIFIYFFLKKVNRE